MSYGTSSYGEASYGEEAGSLSGPVLGFVNEDIGIADTDINNAVFNNIFSELVNNTSTIVSKKIFNAFPSDQVNLSTAISLKTVVSIIEAIRVSSNLSPRSTFGILAIDGVNSSDRIYVSFPISVIDILTIDDTIVVNKGVFSSILSEIEIAESLSSRAVLHNLQTDDIFIQDVAEKFFSEVISDIFSQSDTLIVSRITDVVGSELLNISDSILENIRYGIEVISSFFVSEDPIITTSDSFVNVQDDVIISHIFEKVDIDGFVLNPENYAVSKYLLGFTESAAFNNKFLFADDQGLYELGGTTDNGTAIVSTITTPAMDLGSSNIKQVPSVMLGTNGTSMILKVSVDGSHTTHYQITENSSALMTKHIKIGKGLIGKYWQFTVIADGVDFDLDTFEFYPVIFRRKHNG